MMMIHKWSRIVARAEPRPQDGGDRIDVPARERRTDAELRVEAADRLECFAAEGQIGALECARLHERTRLDLDRLGALVNRHARILRSEQEEPPAGCTNLAPPTKGPQDGR